MDQWRLNRESTGKGFRWKSVEVDRESGQREWTQGGLREWAGRGRALSC